MSNKKNNQEHAVIIAACITAIGTIIAAVIGVKCSDSPPFSSSIESTGDSSLGGSSSNPPSSDPDLGDSGSSSTAPNSSAESTDSSTSVSSSIPPSSEPDSGNSGSSSTDPNSSSGTSPSHKTYLFTDDNGKVKLFNANSGEAYIYKKYLDKNPIGEVDGTDCLIGWAIMLHCNEKELIFHITPSTDEFECTAQYNLNGEWQDTYQNNMNVKREENGDLKIEFDIDEITFDLRDSSSMEIMNIVDPDSI